VYNFVCDYKVLSDFSGDELGQKLSSYFEGNMNNIEVWGGVVVKALRY
jgi:hypothetical protein